MRERTGSTMASTNDSGATRDAGRRLDECGVEKQRQRRSDNDRGVGGFRQLGGSRPRPPGVLYRG
jgi:hypothetical protein